MDELPRVQAATPNPTRAVLAKVLSVVMLVSVPVGAVYLSRRLIEPPAPRSRREIVDDYHYLWQSGTDTWYSNKWLGIQTWQNPNDVWILQEILSEVKPDLYIEAGTYRGGSAVFAAMVLEQVHPAGMVVTIDVEDLVDKATLPPIAKRIEFIIGSSTDPGIVARLGERAKGKKVLVFLDSDHHKAHVLEELKLYAPMVSVGSYLIVQDTDVNEHQARPDFGPGPAEALAEFLPTQDSFVVDHSRERLLHTVSPGGYLKRQK